MNDINTKELFQRAHNGDKEAREYLVESNMKLVYKIANNYKGDWIDFETAVQEGSIGLIKAIDKFEIDRGFQFSTYAVHSIRGEIIRFIRDKREDIPYRLIRSDSSIYIKIQEAKAVLAREFHREPNNEEIALWIGINHQKVDEVINAVENHTSMNNTLYRNDERQQDICVADSIKIQEEISQEQIINKVILEKAFKHLNEKQKKVLQLRYYKDLTQKQTGKILNVTQVHISRIEKQALELIRKVI